MYLVPLLSALLLLACGSDTASESQADPLVCSKNWEVVYSVRQGGQIGQDAEFLQWHEGRLYFLEIVDSARIRSLSPQSKEASAVLEASPHGPYVLDFWIEGEKLLYTTVSDLYSLPLVGGESELVFHRPSFDPGDSKAIFRIRDWALDEEALYWVRNGDEEGAEESVWRGLRGTNEEELVTTLRRSDTETALDAPHIFEIFSRGESVFISGIDGTGGHVWVVPKSGGEARELTRTDFIGPGFLGISENGVVLSAAADGNHHYTATEYRPNGSAPKPLWPLPRDSASLLGRPDGSGGWYLTLLERGTDDASHATVWLLDSAGHRTRLACDPEVSVPVTSAAVAPEGLYVVSDTHTYTRIALIRR